jgi:uncharacterized protein (DUF1684 family)
MVCGSVTGRTCGRGFTTGPTGVRRWDAAPFLLAPVAGLLLIGTVAACSPPSSPPEEAAGAASGNTSYVADIQEWREDRETRLKADGGWLTVAGLFWLEEGESRFGTDPSCEMRLPEGSAPGIAGVFIHRNGSTTVRIEPGVQATVDGEPITTIEMRSDENGPPSVLNVGGLYMYVIRRGDRDGIRLKDMNSKFRKEFTGLRWYTVGPAYRIEARFVPYDPPKEIPIPTVLGTIEPMISPGYVVFSLGGDEVRLDPVLEYPESDQLFLIFSDPTNGKETYPAGRFLKSPLPEDGMVVLDFNRAYNPPCAFTPYATCPLPPKQNRLSIPIEAGELDYGHHSSRH